MIYIKYLQKLVLYILYIHTYTFVHCTWKREHNLSSFGIPKKKKQKNKNILAKFGVEFISTTLYYNNFWILLLVLHRMKWG